MAARARTPFLLTPDTRRVLKPPIRSPLSESTEFQRPAAAAVQNLRESLARDRPCQARPAEGPKRLPGGAQLGTSTPRTATRQPSEGLPPGVLATSDAPPAGALAPHGPASPVGTESAPPAAFLLPARAGHSLLTPLPCAPLDEKPPLGHALRWIKTTGLRITDLRSSPSRSAHPSGVPLSVRPPGK